MATLLDRRAVVAALVADRRDLLAVAGLGSTTYDLAAAGDHPLNFYLWGAMGGGVAMALGLALAQPSRPVLCVTGDGEILMGLGSLATVGVVRPANLSIAVIDNERYAETGMQKTATAHGVDLSGVAAACGIAVEPVADLEGVTRFARRLHSGDGPRFATIKVAAVEPPKVLPARDGAYLRSRFREALLGTAP
ncbi:MAG: aldehyde dehydrogenase [Alphaproteobacteria bacterium]|nr:aldehyde dehydrogenase [Alphaproteobacteria bacterium]